MAEISPTAANIIASLGIRGATVNEQLPGYVPVLDANGMLSANLVPPNAAQLSIQALSNVAFVDPYTDVAQSIRRGSVVAPFKSLQEAAERFVPTNDALAAKYVAFVLAPGKYNDTTMQFPSSRMPLSVYLIGLGECSFASTVTTFTIGGISAAVSGRRPSVLIQNVSMNGTVTVSANADVTVLGKSYVGTLNGLAGTTLRMASESRVDSTNAETVSYLSEDARITNTTSVRGTTVAGAISRLGGRRIRIANMTDDSSGIEIDSSSSYIDVSAESSSAFDLFDLRAHDRVLVDGINRLFQRGKNIVAESVTAQTVVADLIDVRELKMNALTLGGYKLTIDTYGYLVVVDGSVTPPQPPTNVILLRDTVTGAVYMLGVSSGRMYLADADDPESSSESSSSTVQDALMVYDPVSGYTYSVSISNGRMVITRIGG